MKLTSILLLSLLLTSCGDPSDKRVSAPSDLDPNKIHIKIVEKKSLFDKTGDPLPGVPVQLDYDGQTIISDANGRVTFDITDKGRHDFHVYPATEYQWQSHYNVNKGQLYTIKFYNSKTEPVVQNSYISFSGIITNFDQANSYQFSFYENNRNRNISGGRSYSTANADYEIGIRFDYPVGQAVSGQLLVQEYKRNENNSEVLVDSVIVPNITAITSAFGTNTQILDIDGLTLAEPAQSNIVTINQSNLKPGFKLLNLILFSLNQNDVDTITKPNWTELYSYNSGITDLVFPKVFQSYTSYDYPRLWVSAYAEQRLAAYDLFWNYNNIVARNTTFTLNPLITVFPDFPENQQGEIINWNKVDSKLTGLNLKIYTISANSTKLSWLLALDPKATTVRLPKISAARLAVGDKFRIVLEGGIKNGNKLESFKLRSESWAR